MARSVGASLGTRRGLTSPELQRACFSEMVRHVRVTQQGRTHAPTAFVLCLHPDDVAMVDEARRWFTDGLADAVGQAAAENDWVLDGPISIDYRADPSRRPGVPTALASAPGPGGARREIGPPPAVSPSASDRRSATGLALVRSDTGARTELSGGGITIGRSHDRSVTIDDTRVSRLHARIEPRKGGWSLVDERSANGTRVGGEELPTGRPCPLRPGDVIGIGPVDLRVVAGGPPPGPAGTRALDDRDRTRISAEVLPPQRDRDRDPGRDR